MAAKIWISKLCGEGAGAIDDTHISKDILLKNDQIVLSLIYSQLFRCLVSHNKQSDFHFDKNSFKFIFISVLYRIVIGKACHKSKSPIKMYRN